MKGIVEQSFRLLNKEGLHDLLGSTRGGKVVRGSHDPKKDATYTLNEVTNILLEAVLEHNRNIFKELAFQKSILIDNDLSPTPINFWNIHLENHMHALKKADEEQVIVHLLTPVEVSMTAQGLRYKNVYYSCRYLIKNNLSSVARTNGQWQVDARIFEDIVDYIYVKFDKNSAYIKCDLLPSQ